MSTFEPFLGYPVALLCRLCQLRFTLIACLRPVNQKNCIPTLHQTNNAFQALFSENLHVWLLTEPHYDNYRNVITLFMQCLQCFIIIWENALIILSSMWESFLIFHFQFLIPFPLTRTLFVWCLDISSILNTTFPEKLTCVFLPGTVMVLKSC